MRPLYYPDDAAISTAASSAKSGRDLAALSASGIIVAGLGLLWTLLASRFLTAGEYSDFVAAASLIYFASMCAWPVSQSIAYFTVSSEVRGESPGNAIRAVERRIVWGCGVGIIAFAVLSPLLRDALRFHSLLPLWVVAVTVPVLAIGAVRRGFIQGHGRFRLYSTTVTAEAVIRLAALLLVCVLWPRAGWGLATYPLAVVITILFLPLAPPEGDVGLRPLLRYFSLSFVATIVYSAFISSDVILAKLFFSADQAAVYGAASFLARGAAVLVSPFYVYSVTHLAEVEDAAELRRRFWRLLASFAALQALAVVALFAVRKPLVALLLGPQYAQAADLILPLSIAVAIGGLTFIACQLPAARQRFDFLPWYVAGYLLELAAVAIWHKTITQLVVAIIAAQVATLALVSPAIVAALRPRAK